MFRGDRAVAGRVRVEAVGGEERGIRGELRRDGALDVGDHATRADGGVLLPVNGERRGGVPRQTAWVDELLGWCVVANVETVGLKHFSPGTKVWVLPPQWGDGGESVFVIGRHRGRGHGRLVRMVVERRHLTNFRVRGVYRPAVHRELTKEWAKWGVLRQWESQELAEETVAWWSRDVTVRAGVREPRKRIELYYRAKWLMAEPSGRGGQMVTREPPSFEIGVVLRDEQEVRAVSALLDLLSAADPVWSEVGAAAAAVHSLLGRENPVSGER